MTLQRLQELIDSGATWRLEGSVGRAAVDAIHAGYLQLGPTGHTDYWGNYVPARHEVAPGTPGSPEYATTPWPEEDDDDE